MVVALFFVMECFFVWAGFGDFYLQGRSSLAIFKTAPPGFGPWRPPFFCWGAAPIPWGPGPEASGFSGFYGRLVPAPYLARSLSAFKSSTSAFALFQLPNRSILKSFLIFFLNPFHLFWFSDLLLTPSTVLGAVVQPPTAHLTNAIC